MLETFSHEKVDVRKKTYQTWKIANIGAFSSTKPYATNCSIFKNLLSTQNFSTFA